MESPSLLDAARRRWWIVLLLAIAGFVLGALPEPAKVDERSEFTTFYARHVMLVNNQESIGDAAVSPDQVALLATAGEVPKRVAEQLGFDGSPAALAAEVTVSYDFSNGALTFETTQPTADRAVAVADAFADNLNAYLIERQDTIYQDRLAASLERLDELELQLDDLTAQLALDPEDPVLNAQLDAISRQYSVAFEQNESLAQSPAILAFTTLERAQAIEQTSESGGLSAPRSRWVRGAMGAVVGTAIGLGLVVLLGLVDRRVRTREQVEAVMGMRARVTIPKVKQEGVGGLVVTRGRHDPLSDSYRTLRNVVGFVQGGLPPAARARITLVVSPGPGEGKTTLAANLGAAFVETGQRTVVVNADFRRPRLARAITGYPVPEHPFAVQDIDGLRPEWLLSKTHDPELSILDFSGLGPATELVLATAKVIPKLAKKCDSIVIDTSPLGLTAEPLELVALADIIVIVARLGQTNIETAQRSMDTLRDLTTAPILLVVTGVTTDKSAYYEYADRRTGERQSRRKRRYKGPERRYAQGDNRGRRASDTASESPPMEALEVEAVDHDQLADDPANAGRAAE